MRAFVLFQWKGNKQGKEKEQQWRETQRANERLSVSFTCFFSLSSLCYNWMKKDKWEKRSRAFFTFNYTQRRDEWFVEWVVSEERKWTERALHLPLFILLFFLTITLQWCVVFHFLSFTRSLVSACNERKGTNTQPPDEDLVGILWSGLFTFHLNWNGNGSTRFI